MDFEFVTDLKLIITIKKNVMRLQNVLRFLLYNKMDILT